MKYMCLSKVYLIKKGREELVTENVCNVSRKDRDIILLDIIGQETTVKGTIEDIDLLKNKICIKAD